MADFDYSQFDAAFPWFFPLAALLFGACIGSFLNVVIYRLPKGESVVTPGSHCGCGRPIAWHDNIPILSWLVLRGRARCCGRAFSFRYPFIELLTALLFVACWLRHPPAVALVGAIFVSCLVAATWIDLDHFIIPDVFTLGLALAGVALSAAVPALHGCVDGSFGERSLAAVLASLRGLLIGSGLVLWIALVAEAILRKEAMGFGDVKFVGAIGAFCGWQGAVFAMFGGACVGTIWIALAWLWQKAAGRHSPLAPPLEAPPEELEDDAPDDARFEHPARATLLAGLAGVVLSFFLPALHGQASDYFLVDSLRSGTAALTGLLAGSALVLWLVLAIPPLFRNEPRAFCAIQFAGAIGAWSHWQQGPRGFALGAALALGVAALFWAASRAWSALRPPPPSAPAAPAVAAEAAAPAPAPARLGFGVHVPFGPMLAVAGGLHFLFFRDWLAAWFGQLGQFF